MMKRSTSLKIAFILDQLIPPLLRDARWFMYPLFRYAFKREHALMFMTFKEKAPYMTPQEFDNYYIELSSSHFERPTDLKDEHVDLICKSIVGEKVLDIACGRGYLLEKIAATNDNVELLGIDLNIESLSSSEKIKYERGHVEQIPYPDNHFDTVICTHTIEHVQNVDKAIAELRRVCKKRLIIVVPKQREYRYTFDLHLHFFPYISSFQKHTNNPQAHCDDTWGDIYYQEDF